MRSKNAIKNLTLYFAYEIVIFALGIIFPRFIILNYGSEINGLTSTITRILSLINLIQAGAVGAAIYQMYKPVAEEDYETQSAIIYSSRKFYNKISIIYLSCALLIGVFYSLYLKNGTLSFISIFMSFVILAFNGMNILLFNSICDIYISPHQKKYLLLIASILEQLVRYGLLAIVLIFKMHFLFIYICYFIGGLVSISINYLFYKKLSKNKITKSPINKHFVIPNRKYLMMSSIGSELVTLAPTIIITTFISLSASSVFSVYAMVYTSMKTILNSIQLSFSAIFGNLVKTSDDTKVSRVYKVIELITILMGTIASCCVAFLIMPFIELYTYGVSDINYLYLNLSIFVVVYTIIFTFRTSFSFVSTVYGLFKDYCFIVLLFGGIGILISLISVLLFGMPYAMLGLIFNEIGCSVATLVVMKKKIRWFNIRSLVLRSIVMVLIVAISFFVYFYVEPKISTWTQWIIIAIFVGLCSIAFVFIYCLIFERQTLKYCLNYIKLFFHERIQKS